MFPNSIISDLVCALCAPCRSGSGDGPCAHLTFPDLLCGWPCACLARTLCIPCAYLVRAWCLTLCLTLCATWPGTSFTYLVHQLARHKPDGPCAQGGGAEVVHKALVLFVIWFSFIAFRWGSHRMILQRCVNNDAMTKKWWLDEAITIMQWRCRYSGDSTMMARWNSR